jgi:metallophosphoesterase (TIGR00282 family)
VDRHRIDLVVANGENASVGIGLSIKGAEELLASGVHIITSGNHIWKKKEIFPYIQESPDLIRPANYPSQAPGHGSVIKETASGTPVAVLNLMGRTFMEAVDCPFQRADVECARLRQITPLILIDFHAEATSEKTAMGWFLDGRASAVLGTHTHVQTSDERLLPRGTAFMTDVGMTGPADSVIGVKKEIAIDRFLTQLPHKFEVAKRDLVLEGALIQVDETSGRALAINRLRERLSPAD